MIELSKIRKFISDNSSFNLNEIYVGRIYDEKPEKVLITFLSSNEQEITFGNIATYGEAIMNVKYNGSENYDLSFKRVNELFNVFKDNREDSGNNIRLFIPQQPILIGKNNGIYKFEIIVQIKFDY